MRVELPISRWWMQGAILTYLVGFCILGFLAYLGYAEQPPIPERVVAGGGTPLMTRDDILDGMNVFERYGIMEYGSIYGHGAYLGPDFTADYLHRSAESLIRRYSNSAGEPAARADVTAELKQNTYDPATSSLVWSDERGRVHRELVDHYRTVFQNQR